MKLPHLLTALALASATLATVSLAQQPAPAAAAAPVPPTKENYLRLHDQVEKSLVDDDLKKFFPAAVDEMGGGFFETFSENWTHGGGRGGGGGGRGGRGGRGGAPGAAAGAAGAAPAAAPAAPAAAPVVNDPVRSVVYQARLTWLASQAAERYPEKRAEYLKYAKHGAEFLETKQWDQQNGGFIWSVDSSGMPTGQGANSKHVYGVSFGMYALAGYYKVSKDPAALEAAKKTFAWLEKYAHDDKNGGYFEQIQADNSRNTSTTGNDTIGTRNGLKSMNTHIHLLESMTELLEVWPDELVKKRTEELYTIGLNKIAADPGWLRMFFQQDWTPVEGRDSYGHDIETAYLFAEAASALGKADDPKGWEMGKKIVDHCLAVAFDQQNGFLNGEGTIQGQNMGGNLEWWVEAESLNAMLLMHEKFGKNDPKYWNAFVKQWNFIDAHFIDKTNGGWYKGVSTQLQVTRGAKTDAWTEGYHQGRAMFNVTERLKRLAEATK